MRAVLDTNVLVRAMLSPSGAAGALVQRLRDGAFVAVYSASLLAECQDVLNRPRLRSRYLVTNADIDGLLALLVVLGEEVVPTRFVTACRDPKDNMVLDAALAGAVDLIVSADEDLLVLHPFENIPIVTPPQCLARLRETPPLESQ